LLETSKGYAVKADRLHTNGMQLNEILGKLKLAQASGKNPTQLVDEYHKILKSCPENHDPDDYLMFQTGNVREFNITSCQAWWIRRYLYLKILGFYLLLMLLPLVIFIVYLVDNFWFC
jgi:hypothetical protein